MRKLIGWIVVDQEKKPVHEGTERRTRSEAIRAFQFEHEKIYVSHNWQYYPKMYGYRCIRLSDLPAKYAIKIEKIK